MHAAFFTLRIDCLVFTMAISSANPYSALLVHTPLQLVCTCECPTNASLDAPDTSRALSIIAGLSIRAYSSIEWYQFSCSLWLY
jgi:hypothetical protein